MAKINPFRPHHPVHPGMFVGRVDELRRLENALVQTRAENPVNFMITGERGIGKSSLLTFIKHVAEGTMEGLTDSKLSFLVIDTDVAPGTSQVGLVKKMELGIDHALGSTESARTFLKQTWEVIKRFEAGGIKLKPEEKSDAEAVLLEEFSYSLAEIASRVCAEGASSTFSARYDGLLILIDEADNASDALLLGSFLKLLNERLHRRGCTRIAFGIAGLPELRGVLSKSHRSSLRLFEEIILGRLSNAEAERVIEIGLNRANQNNEEKVGMSDEAKKLLAGLSEGYPHFIQQFAYSAFAADTDNFINEKDATDGAFGRRGAMELIGDRYYRDDFYNKIQKESYRQVLRIMANKLDDWVTKAEIKKQFSGKESILDNAIFALRDRKIILAKEGERGVYRLQHKGFALWIKLYTQDQGSLQQSLPTTEEGNAG